MKRIAILVLLVGAFAALVACERTVTQDARDAVAVDAQQQQYAKVQPVPFYDFSSDRDTLIQIYNQKNEVRQTHTIVTSDGTGDLIFQCPSIGYGIPADTQLTNGQALTTRIFNNSTSVYQADGVVEQAEPNGLYSSKNTDGTYVLCVLDDGTVSPVQTEGKVTTFPFPVVVNADGSITPTGPATITVDVKDGTTGEAPPAEETPAP